MIRQLKNKEIWHEWFAWRPIIIDNKFIWWETVEREFHWNWAGCWYEYRLIQKGWNMESKQLGEMFFETFMQELRTDEESWLKKGERILREYEKADDKTKAIYDDIFITLCGWSITGLIHMILSNRD